MISFTQQDPVDMSVEVEPVEHLILNKYDSTFTDDCWRQFS